MVSDSKTAPPPTVGVVATGRGFENASAPSFRPTQIADPDCEIHDWESKTPILEIPPSFQERNPLQSARPGRTDGDGTKTSDKQSTPQTAGSIPSDTTAVSPSSRTSGPTRKSTKRARAPSDVMSSDRDSQSSRPRRQRTEDRTRVILSCPFYKWDPARYRRCRSILLTKISYVKQHILRAHRMPPHCQICNTLFHTDEELRQHVRSMTCERRPYSPPDGVTEDQIFQLRSRVNQKNSLEGQWYEVFEIIFPNTQRPVSVYLDPELSQDLDEFVNFLTTHGPRILLEKVGAAELTGDALRNNHSSVATQNLIADLSKALESVYDRWYRSRSADETSPSIPRPPPALAAGVGYNPEPNPLRPPSRNFPPISAHGIPPRSQHETSFAIGGSEGYVELAPLQPPRRGTWETAGAVTLASQGMHGSAERLGRGSRATPPAAASDRHAAGGAGQGTKPR